MTRPPLSTILATKDPWPHARATIESLIESTAAFGGEIVVADGDGDGLPPGGYDGVVWVRRPGASVFELRALAVAHASGEVVAATEDHCVVPAGWGEGVLAAHRERPDAAAVAGPIGNGAGDTLADWANYLMVFSSFMPPLGPPTERIPPPPSLSYKRAVLPESEPAPGWMDFQLNPALERSGRIARDDRAETTHIQRNSLAGHLITHFHNARTTGGAVAEGSGPRRRRRLLRTYAGRPLAETRATMRVVWGRRHDLPRRARTAIPLVPLFTLVTGFGQIAGVVAGPGRSAMEVD